MAHPRGAPVRHAAAAIHPIHHDLAYFAGWKVVVVVLWLPLAAVLSLAFHPAFEITAARAVAFLAAIWGAYLIRSMFLWVLGMITFWTTRASAVFSVWFTLELLLSGRLVPLALMPSWARALAGLATGGTLLAAVAFTAALAAFTRWAWKQGLRHYSGASA